MRVLIVIDDLPDRGRQAVNEIVARQQRIWQRIFTNTWIINDRYLTAEEWLDLVKKAAGVLGEQASFLVLRDSEWVAHGPRHVIDSLQRTWGPPG